MFEGGKGANVLSSFYKRGQMSTIIHLLRGQMSSPVNHLGGRCPHIPFFTGGQMSEGANVRLPWQYSLVVSYMVGNPEDRFSHNEAHMILTYLL